MTKCFNSPFCMFLLIFPFFNPTSLKYIPGLVMVYDVIQIWKLCAIVVIIIIYFSRRHISAPIALILCWVFIMIFTSLANNVHDSKIFTNALLFAGISMLTELAVKNDFYRFAKMQLIILLVLAAINFALCIFYPSGLRSAVFYNNWKNPLHFLSIDNAMMKELLPLLVLAYYVKFCDESRNIMRNMRLVNYIFIFVNVMCLTTLAIVGSASGIVAFLVFAVLMLGYSVIWKRHLPYKMIMGIYVLFIVAVTITSSNLSIVTFVSRLLGRTNTLTGRFSLYTRAIDMILQSPIIGYGYTSGNIRIWGGTFSSHNMFLEMLLQGGLLLGLLFVIIIVYAINKNQKASAPYSNLIFSGIFVFLVIGVVETGVNLCFFELIILACYPDLKQNGRMVSLKY